MARLPRDPAFDSTLALLREGYRFIPERCRRLDTDIFRTRLMLRKVVCMSGPAAAEAFYEDGRFTRRDATPRSTLRLLQDYGSVQGLDGPAHRHRKAMFMLLTNPRRVADLNAMLEDSWRARMRDRAAAEGDTVLLDAAREALCEAACRWAGVPAGSEKVRELARDLAAMIDCAGTVGPRNWRATWRRRGVERWLADVAGQVRSRSLSVPDDSALGIVASHRDDDGRLLDRTVVAVEMLNLLRPIVAIANYIVFGALALHRNPGWRRRLAQGDGPDRERFVQEVRRFFPFFPCVAGRVMEPFSWRGHRFGRGDWAILDIYGTNRDARSWVRPESFHPERFADWSESAFDFIPQGGGDPQRGHRCPGDRVAVELAGTALVLLAGEITYDVPDQDLDYDLGKMPSLPKSGFVIRDIRIEAPGSGRPAGRP